MDDSGENIRNGIKILVVGADLTFNKGGPAIFSGCLVSLRAADPQAKITFLSTAGNRDLVMAEKFGVDILGVSLKKMLFFIIPRLATWHVIRRFRIKWSKLLQDPVIREIMESDIYLDITGINFTDHMKWRSWFKQTMRLLPGIFSGCVAIKYPHATGPFRKWMNRRLAKYCLKHVRLAIARGDHSKKFLDELGIPSQIEMRADTAFLMPAADSGRIREILSREYPSQIRGPLIGISPSNAMHYKMSQRGFSENRYEQLLAALIDFIIEKTGGNILLVPHSSVPTKCEVSQDISDEDDGRSEDRQLWGLSILSEDDAWVSRRIRRQTKDAPRVHVLSSDYSPEELKGIIGECECFVASRFHSMVAALGMQVPTMVIGWSHKYAEVLDMFGQKDFCCTDDEITLDTLTSMFSKLWQKRKIVREELAQALPKVNASAMSCGQLILDLYEKEESERN